MAVGIEDPLALGQSRSSSSQKLKLSAGSLLNKWGEGAHFFYLLSPFTLSFGLFFFCKKRSSKCQAFQERCSSDNTIGWRMATVDGHSGHMTLLLNFPEAEAFTHPPKNRGRLRCLWAYRQTRTNWMQFYFQWEFYFLILTVALFPVNFEHASF